MSDELQIPVDPRFVDEITGDEEKLQVLVTAASSFSGFLKHWHFIDQEHGEDKILGDVIWSSQDQYIEAMEEIDKIFMLKARKLGATTLGTAYDGFAARFGVTNGRVHLFSRRDDAAKELLAAVKYGLDRLPEWMRLPYGSKNQTELELTAGEEDTRTVKSYPTSEETAVEKTCNHAHIDEWARMRNPRLVYQAVEPTLAGSAHIITTGRGPVNYASLFWKDCLAGDTDFTPIFTSALDRPDRDTKWLESKRRGMPEESFRQEYPSTWEDALFAGGRFTFRARDIDIAGRGTGPADAVESHRYVKAWDIGRHQDAAVCTVLDASTTPTQVVHYERLRGMPYPTLQRRIESVHEVYPDGITVVERNAAGEAVCENLGPRVKRHELIQFWTGPQSKAKILEGLQLALENAGIQWSAGAWPQLDAEIRGYQIPDDEIVQDSVITLAIAIEHLAAVYTAGRVGRAIGFN